MVRRSGDSTAPGASADRVLDDAPVIDLWSYWGIAVKHRIVILGALLAAIFIAAIVTLLMEPIYTAETTIQIDRQSTRVLDTEDVNPIEAYGPASEFYQTQYGLLRSRSLAERVVDSLGLAASDESLAALGLEPVTGGTAAERANRRRKAAVGVIMSNLHIAPVRDSRLVAIRYDSPAPEMAARIANAVAESFIQDNLNRKYESSAYAREFLEERIAQTKARLEDAERQLVAYASEQQIVSVTDPSAEAGAPPPQSLVAGNLGAANASLAQARSARIAAEERWRVARNAPVMSLPEVLANPTIQQLVQRQTQLSSEYQQKLGTFRPEYPEMQRLSAQIEETNDQILEIATNIRNSIENQYIAALNEERALAGQVTALTGDVLDLRNRSIQYNILQRELDTTRTLYDGLLQRYKEVGVTGDITANNISIVDRATPPGSPSKPDLMMNLILAAFFGLGIGLLAALILEALDESLTTQEDVEEKLGLPVLGIVPLLDRGITPAAALADPRSMLSEAYYSIRTALQFSTPDGAPATLLVTSSRPAEGKSTTAYAIALNLARIGRRVLLVDGDLRNPSMHRVVGVENEAGMSNLLSGNGDLPALVKPTSQQGLEFLACGPLPPNPAELWGGDRLRLVFGDAAQTYDHIVIDGPPVLGFADAPLLASAVHATVLVVESKQTRRAQARGALRRLVIGDTHVLGAILTKFNVKATRYGGYDYSYDYHYGASDPASRKSK